MLQPVLTPRVAWKCPTRQVHCRAHRLRRMQSTRHRHHGDLDMGLCNRPDCRRRLLNMSFKLHIFILPSISSSSPSRSSSSPSSSSSSDPASTANNLVKSSSSSFSFFSDFSDFDSRLSSSISAASSSSSLSLSASSWSLVTLTPDNGHLEVFTLFIN